MCQVVVDVEPTRVLRRGPVFAGETPPAVIRLVRVVFPVVAVVVVEPDGLVGGEESLERDEEVGGEVAPQCPAPGRRLALAPAEDAGVEVAAERGEVASVGLAAGRVGRVGVRAGRHGGVPVHAPTVSSRRRLRGRVVPLLLGLLRGPRRAPTGARTAPGRRSSTGLLHVAAPSGADARRGGRRRATRPGAALLPVAGPRLSEAPGPGRSTRREVVGVVDVGGPLPVQAPLRVRARSLNVRRAPAGQGFEGEQGDRRVVVALAVGPQGLVPATTVGLATPKGRPAAPRHKFKGLGSSHARREGVAGGPAVVSRGARATETARARRSVGATGRQGTGARRDGAPVVLAGRVSHLASVEAFAAGQEEVRVHTRRRATRRLSAETQDVAVPAGGRLGELLARTTPDSLGAPLVVGDATGSRELRGVVGAFTVVTFAEGTCRDIPGRHTLDRVVRRSPGTT